LELYSNGKPAVIRFSEIARWPKPAWFWKWLFSLGIRPRWLPVADRDWFHAPPDRFFRFYTTPPLIVYMPDSEAIHYTESCFVQLRQLLETGGYHTIDLG
jgi:hypothetical protein